MNLLCSLCLGRSIHIKELTKGNLKNQIIIIQKLSYFIQEQPMQEEGKLVSCESLQGDKLQFIVLNKQQLGSGAFGVVKRAYEQSRQHQQLAVKIIAYEDKKSRQKINQQVDILRHLPDHANLVKVIPLKCFSEHNFYIFMEYCNQGTLQGMMRSKSKNKQNFTEEEIFETFYQILMGYQVLWRMKILHQDLKPENILIKNGVFKITDFGFSIFHQGVKFSKQRQGTFSYMPLQKLTVADYNANTKSDIFSLGVIFFKMITGRHPYVINNYQNYKQYIDQLRIVQLTVPTYIRARMSMPMQHLFDLVLKMVAKKQAGRIDFDQVYKFIQEEQMFLNFAVDHGQNQSVFSEEVQLPEKRLVHINQISKAFVIPFSIPRSEEEQYEKLLLNQHVASEETNKIQIIQKIDRYLCSMRLMVYFFDRLNRKLIVEKMKKQIWSKSNQELNKELNEEGQIQENTILGLLYLSTKITVQTIQQSRNCKKFVGHDWKTYKSHGSFMLQIIKKDQQYLKNLTNDYIMETRQSKIADRKRIIDLSKKPLLQFMQSQVRVRLVQLLQTRTAWISSNDRKAWTTLNYIISAIDIIDNFKQRNQKWQQLEGLFRQMQVQQINKLQYKVTNSLDKLGIPYSVDQGQWESQLSQEHKMLKS